MRKAFWVFAVLGLLLVLFGPAWAQEAAERPLTHGERIAAPCP